MSKSLKVLRKLLNKPYNPLINYWVEAEKFLSQGIQVKVIDYSPSSFRSGQELLLLPSKIPIAHIVSSSPGKQVIKPRLSSCTIEQWPNILSQTLFLLTAVYPDDILEIEGLTKIKGCDINFLTIPWDLSTPFSLKLIEAGPTRKFITQFWRGEIISLEILVQKTIENILEKMRDVILCQKISSKRSEVVATVANQILNLWGLNLTQTQGIKLDLPSLAQRVKITNLYELCLLAEEVVLMEIQARPTLPYSNAQLLGMIKSSAHQMQAQIEVRLKELRSNLS